MVTIPVRCPHCHSTEVIKAGKQANGAQRYQCQNDRCARWIFLLQYQDRGRIPEIRRQVVDMALNGSGIRDTARVLRISPTTVIAVLKKSPRASTRQPCVGPPPCSRGRTVRIPSRREAELDKMWSCVRDKATARWLWHAIAHRTGRGLAYVVGTRKDVEGNVPNLLILRRTPVIVTEGDQRTERSVPLKEEGRWQRKRCGVRTVTVRQS